MNTAHREYYWNIHHHWMMYVFLAAAAIIFALGVRNKIALWKKMKPADERLSGVAKRLWLMIVMSFSQGRVRNRRLPGVFHSLIFWSFLMLTLATIILTIEIDVTKPFGITFFKGPFYLVISALADLAGFLFIVGLGVAIVRRYILKPKSLQNDWQNAFMLALLMFIGLGGFLLEGIRIEFAGDKWAAFTPFGLATASLAGLLPNRDVASVAYQFIWWSHMGATMVLIASLPYTKFFHILLIPANYMFSSMNPKGTFEREDLEELFSREDADEFSLGHTSAKDLTWKNALDLDACIECGRCEDVCPVCQSGYQLNPRKVVKTLKESLYKYQSAQEDAKTGPQGGEAAVVEPAAFVEDGLEESALWMCRTCRACAEVCPAMVEHVDHIVEVRRSEVMMNGRLPNDAKNALKAMETRGNPFGSQQNRLGWIKGEAPEILEAGGKTDVLFWIGCVSNYDMAKQHIIENMMDIMRKSGIKFAVLGDEEFCCGDAARCLGDENVFQAMAKQQVEILNGREFKKILTVCPHCLNTLGGEYKQFGGNYEVVHHAEFLLELVKSGRIEMKEAVAEKVVYHDPCYLSRYPGIVKEPRNLMSMIKGLSEVEPKNHGCNSVCCGGGGGNFFMDMDLDAEGGERLNVRRTRELADTGAGTIAVSCPYCMQMLEDGVKLMEMEETLKVADISSLVAMGMGLRRKTVEPAKKEESAPAGTEAETGVLQ